jgi:hypothetical protein
MGMAFCGVAWTFPLFCVSQAISNLGDAMIYPLCTGVCSLSFPISRMNDGMYLTLLFMLSVSFYSSSKLLLLSFSIHQC